MKRQLTSILLFSALLMGGASTFVSCTDHESDAAYEQHGTIAEELKKQADEFNNYVTKTDGLITNLQTQLNDLKNKHDQDITDLNGKINALKGELATAKTEIANAQATADKALAQANTNAADIDQLKKDLAQAKLDLTEEINRVAQLVQDNKDALDALAARVTANEANIQQNTDYIMELLQMIENLEESTNMSINSLTNQVNDLWTKLAEDEATLQQVVDGQATLQQAVDALNTKLDEKVNKDDFESVKAQVEANKADIATLKTQYDEIKSEMAKKVSQEDFDVLTAKVSTMETALKNADDALSTKINDLEAKVNEKLNELFAAMANMVTGIELQATESPISGYENLSFLGAEAHILGTYYGTANKMAKIGDETINAQDLLITENGENAGVVYATINPSNKDFSGLKLKVVDSQGNEAPFTATVTKSDRVLKYGINRASASNLYAIKINLDKDKINDAKTWTSADAAELKDAAKQVLEKLKDRSNNLNLTDVSTTVAKTFNNRLTAYGLQLEQEITVNGKTETRNITSKLSLAATALRPLSYKFLEDGIKYNLRDIPTLESKGLYINTDDLKWTNLDHIADINQTIDVDVPDVDAITIDGNKVKINASGELVWADPNNKTDINDLKGVKVTVNGITFLANAVKCDKTKKQTVTVTVSMAQFNTMIDQINSQVGNMLGTVTDLANKVNGYVDNIDGSIINRVNNYIHKFNYYLDNANKFLQPAMFATDGTNWAKLPTIYNGATYTKQGSSIVLVATSYTAELLAPAYKKYITVTSPSGQKVSGVRLNQVLDGDWHKVGFTASELGTYTINYQAVDYSGNVVSKNFYVKAVK